MVIVHSNNNSIIWSKPGSINTPQKQDENRGFGRGQAAGRTPGKLGGNVPVKLAKMRGKKEQQTESKCCLKRHNLAPT